MTFLARLLGVNRFSGLVVLVELALVVEELGQRGSSRIVVELASGLVMALMMYAA